MLLTAVCAGHDRRISVLSGYRWGAGGPIHMAGKWVLAVGWGPSWSCGFRASRLLRGSLSKAAQASSQSWRLGSKSKRPKSIRLNVHHGFMTWVWQSCRLLLPSFIGKSESHSGPLGFVQGDPEEGTLGAST